MASTVPAARNRLSVGDTDGGSHPSTRPGSRRLHLRHRSRSALHVCERTFAAAFGFTPAQMVSMTMLDAYGESHVEALYRLPAARAGSANHSTTSALARCALAPMAQRGGLGGR